MSETNRDEAGEDPGIHPWRVLTEHDFQFFASTLRISASMKLQSTSKDAHGVGLSDEVGLRPLAWPPSA